MPMPAVMNARGFTLPPVAKVAIEMIQLEFAVAALTWGHGGMKIPTRSTTITIRELLWLDSV